MNARVADMNTMRGCIGATAPTAIITMNFVTQTKMAIATFAEKIKAMENNSGNMTNGGCLRILIAIVIMCIVAFYILTKEPEILTFKNINNHEEIFDLPRTDGYGRNISRTEWYE